MAHLHQNIILGPIVTEKSLAAQSAGYYSFWVSFKASKTQIAAAFKSIFKETPLKVRTMRLIGKLKSDPRTRRQITKPDRKRAIIKIAKDKKIELLSLNTK